MGKPADQVLNPDTAVTIVTGGIKFRWQKKLSKRRRSINTNVFVRRQNGDWKLASFQNSRIQPPGFLQDKTKAKRGSKYRSLFFFLLARQNRAF
ncbi:hypothetical protein A8C56_14390 [Niabella ginsenosidivorans]|uniref:SnoaL-like domain-containing protein n=1 Tax=Niabella ginsenosidivorans TaxID=1176587 RepID=A0A1A9I5Q2_9BACT|nr:hypothetical protein A8C56_14390 [Niabella ginsenosidivorans]